MPSLEEILREQRRALPDSPGVYLFKDAGGRTLYVGKAKSIRKRVASHFTSGPASRTAEEFLSKVDSIDFVATANEAEALLAEQNFIKRYRPPYNIRLRDDKSYPYIGISLDERFPRVYFTRERHRAERVYFGPFSSAKRVRETLDLLGKLFPYRTCDGAEPGRSSGSPCLDYYIKRCQAPCVDYIGVEEYRANIDAIISFLSGRYRAIERELEERMQEAANAQEFERAAAFRNRLRAVRSLFERQRVANESVGTLDVIAVAVDGTDANAQVFQVRDGVLADRQSFYLENRAGRSEAEVAEEFTIQYYSTSLSIPAEIVGPPSLAEAEIVRELLAERRDGPVELRHARRGEKRRIYELAERNARLALEQDKLRTERRRAAARRRAQRSARGARPRRDPGADRVLRHLEPRARPTRSPRWSCSRAARRRSRTTGASRSASWTAARTTSPRWARCCRGGWRSSSSSATARRTTRPATPASPHCPGLIVIDGGKGQLASGVAALGELIAEGVAVVSLAKRLEEIHVPGRKRPILLPPESAALQLLQRIRDEAHRFAIEHHRIRRDRSMKALGPRRAARHRPGPQAHAAAPLRLARALPGRLARGARGGARACRERSRARFTSS